VRGEEMSNWGWWEGTFDGKTGPRISALDDDLAIADALVEQL